MFTSSERFCFMISRAVGYCSMRPFSLPDLLTFTFQNKFELLGCVMAELRQRSSTEWRPPQFFDVVNILYGLWSLGLLTSKLWAMSSTFTHVYDGLLKFDERSASSVVHLPSYLQMR